MRCRIEALCTLGARISGAHPTVHPCGFTRTLIMHIFACSLCAHTNKRPCCARMRLPAACRCPPTVRETHADTQLRGIGSRRDNLKSDTAATTTTTTSSTSKTADHTKNQTRVLAVFLVEFRPIISTMMIIGRGSYLSYPSTTRPICRSVGPVGRMT